MKRTQIYLDDEQDRRLAERAAAARRTKSELIREALDTYLDRPTRDERRLAEFRAAADAAFGTAPYLPEDYVERLRDVDRTRAEELDRYWHGDE